MELLNKNMDKSIDFKKIREELPTEVMQQILFDLFNVESVEENDSYIIFPTCCHNLEGGSHKLYFYKENKIFKCYTECQGSFDFIELLQKMYTLRGEEKTAVQIVKDLNLDDKYSGTQEEEYKLFLAFKKYEAFVTDFHREIATIPESSMNRFKFKLDYLKPWIEEGITIDTLIKFGIKYDESSVAIVIPHRDKDGNLIGIRGRFMEEDVAAKYMPLTVNGELKAHPLGSNLYGLYENKESIKDYKTVVIFEAEKSVLKMDSIYGSSGRNFSVAVCGNQITNTQIQLLRDLGVEDVVLAFDKDYHPGDYKAMQERYDNIGRKLSIYFNTSIIFDYSSYLGYKDSPIDKGKESFEKLYKYRYFL